MPHLEFDISVYSSETRFRRHDHDELQLSIVLKGAVSETVGGVTEYGTSLSVVSKDSGLYHANSFAPHGATIVRLSLRDALLSDLIDFPSRATGWKWTHDATVARPFVRLARQARLGGLKHVAHDDADLLELLAGFTARPARNPSGVPPRWLADTMEWLRESWRPSLRVANVAARAGVHPVYLARTIRRWYGTGVAEEMRRLRLRAALDALSGSPQTVSAIAHETGFADEAHLCREFGRAVGIAPGRYRAMVKNPS